MSNLTEAETQHCEQAATLSCSCIYGTRFNEQCAVRVELAKRQDVDVSISKWLQQPKIQAFQEASMVLDQLKETLKMDRDLQLLSAFCASCPVIGEKKK